MADIVGYGGAGDMSVPVTGGPNITAGQAYAAAGLINAYGASEAQRAQAINQQTAYLVQARDALAVADVRAEMSETYAAIQAGRMIKRAEIEAQNYTIAGNQLLRNLRKSNAAARARAAAAGVAFGEGSAAGVQLASTRAAMQDVGIADLNALTARVMGFEDATAMIQSTEYQNMLNMFAAKRAAGGLEAAAATTRRTGGLIAGATLTEGATRFARSI